MSKPKKACQHNESPLKVHFVDDPECQLVMHLKRLIFIYGTKHFSDWIFKLILNEDAVVFS